MTAESPVDWRRTRWYLLAALIATLLIVWFWPRTEKSLPPLNVSIETDRESYLLTEWVDARAIVQPIVPNARYEWYVDQGELQPNHDRARARTTNGRMHLQISVLVTAPDGRTGRAHKPLKLLQSWNEAQPAALPLAAIVPQGPPAELTVEFDKKEVCKGEAVRARARARSFDGSPAQIYYSFAKAEADDDYRTGAIISAGLDTPAPTKPGTYTVLVYATHEKDVLEDVIHGGAEKKASDKNLTTIKSTFTVNDCEAPEPMWGIDFTATQSAGHEYWFRAWDQAAMKKLDEKQAAGATIGHMQKTPLMQRVVKYEWDFGDGNTAVSKSPRVLHTFTPKDPVPEIATMRIKLKVTRDDGKTGESAHYVWIKYWDSEITRPALAAFASLPTKVGNEWKVRLAVYSEGAVGAKIDVVHRHEKEWVPGDPMVGAELVDPTILYDRLDLPPGAVTRGELILPADAFANDTFYTYIVEAKDSSGKTFFGSFAVGDPKKFAPAHVGTWKDPDAVPENKPSWMLDEPTND